MSECFGMDLIEESIDSESVTGGVWGMFSGGHDSLVACDIASQHKDFRGVLHFNTGIGVEETRDFVRDTSRKMGWILHEFKAEDLGFRYDDICLEYGFPGSNERGHLFMYSKLKERSIRAFMGKTKGRICLVSGARSAESTRRMGNACPCKRIYRQVWVNPIHSFSKSDRNDFISKRNLPTNPVVDKLCKSGECLCGAFAQKGELDELEFWYPDAAKRIRDLEVKVRSAGFPWGWEDSPPKWFKEKKQGQTFMLNYDQPMCWSCNVKKQRTDDI